ncbi:PASTA domain-containing protein [Vicingus serpentipes]|jgi:cell division protein FtsI (penicillin-binding protein 3)|uniref:PASTA domain-containing protein n=1 Tax=Vicingus serpentipes TaxID=1926625 RepID=A0A5C6RNI1_9FLAO|nr:penicillin-binding protein [Vicingus serpentipes]TXB63968.1 PASTA domain-containing protein [Vicingus serpentipes]
MKNLRKDILSRVYLVYAFIALFAIIILGQTINVQYVQGEEWRQKAENLTTGFKNIEAVRGNLYAADGSLLATSVPIYEVRFDVNTEALSDEVFYGEIDSLCIQLSELFPSKTKKQYKAEFISARKKGSRYHLVKRNVKYTELKELKTFHIFNRGKFKGGLIYTQQNKRVRPFEVLAARTIGYEREGVKPVGLEGAYTKDLSGVNGKRLMQKIAGGVWMPISDDNEVEPQDGSDVYTTIDINIQDVAENALRKQLEMHAADHGCVALMEVSTGQIKAIANLSLTKSGTYYETYNYMIGESTEPGSVFKLPALMAAFEDGYVSLDDMVNTEDGTTKFYDKTMRDSHKGGFGIISVKRAFEVSSNVAISKLINENYADKPQQFVDRLYKMNLNKRLGIEVAGEGMPLIKSTDDESWSGVSLPWMSIGYESHLTPLQILTFYNAVANNGKMVKPMFVKQIKHRGKVVKDFKTEVINNSICSKKTIEMAQEMLLGVVEEGTARNLKNSTYKIAGKTGTAQIANDKYGYKYESKISHQASFVGYFPADNPKYTCIVVVNAPSRNVFYGNLVAGPIFKEVADKVYANSISIHAALKKKESYAASKIPYAKDGYYDDLAKIYKELGVKTKTSQKVNEWVKVSTGANEVQVYHKKVAPIYIPDVTGLSVKDAVFLLENQGLVVKFSGSGTVKKQSINPGEKAVKGAKIILELV